MTISPRERVRSMPRLTMREKTSVLREVPLLASAVETSIVAPEPMKMKSQLRIKLMHGLP